MSEPTNAQIAEQEDMRLDAQIAELMEARYYAATGNLAELDEVRWMIREPPPILEEVEACNP